MASPNEATRVTTSDLPNDAAEQTEAEPQPVKQKKKQKLSKAQKKALKRQKQIEFEKLELAEKIKRELELSQRTAERYQQRWEEMCMEVKMKELKTEVLEWEQKTQRVMAEKDEKIKFMLEEMELTQEKHKRNFEQQLQVLDYATSCYNTIITTAKQLYEYEAQQTIVEFHEELNARKEIQDSFRLNCENVMHATATLVERQMVDDYDIYVEKRELKVNTETVRRIQIRDTVTAKMKVLQKQLDDFINSLVNSTLNTKKNERVNKLLERQRNFVSETRKLNDVEFHLTRNQGEMQRELLSNELNAQRRFADLRLEREYFMQVRKGIEHTIAHDRRTSSDKMQVVTGECYDMLKDYEKLLKYGELLLTLSAACRKLQTESEKVVVPKVDHQAAEEEMALNLEAINLEQHLGMTEKELMKKMTLMNNFWHRQALAVTQNLLLAREKRELLEENQKYKNFIKLMSRHENIEDMSKTLTVMPILTEKQTKY